MNILLEGIFYNGHGLAEGNRILLRILDQAGYRVRILARDKVEKRHVLPPEEIMYISAFEQTELTSKDIYLFNWVGTYARYNPEFKVNIGRTTFESDRIPESWVRELNRFDEVWVQSRFNRTTFLQSGVVVPLKLIPNFFDLSKYNVVGPALTLPVRHSYLFLSVFDLKLRKGYDVLLKAFLSEFDQNEDVALVIKIRDERKSGMVEEIIASHPKPPNRRPAVYVIDEMLTPDELHGLYRACDAFVLPTRGEGWGRPFFEAMLMELPVIGTNWSGHTDFMTDDTSYLVDVQELVQINCNENPSFIGHYWAEPSEGDLRRKMRRVFKRRGEASTKAREAKRQLLENYSMKATSDKVIHELSKYKKFLSSR